MARVFRALAETDAHQVGSHLRDPKPGSIFQHWTPTISMLLVSVIPKERLRQGINGGLASRCTLLLRVHRLVLL